MKEYAHFSFGDLSISMHYQPEIIDKMWLNDLLRKYGYLTSSNNLLIPATYIIDYVSNKYIAMSSNIQDLVGYPIHHFSDEGVEFFLKITDKSDLSVCMEKVLPFNLSFLKKIPHEEHGQYVFSHNYRINAKGGNQVVIYQQYTIIISPHTGLPIYSLGLISDITQLKKDSHISHQIVRLSNEGHTSEKRIVFSAEYNPEYSILSKREIEILRLLAGGFNSREIADKLYISESTVTIHRKSMLEKSNSKNVAQLIAYAGKNNLI